MRLLVLTFFLIGCCFPVLGWGQVGMLSKGNWVKIAVPNEGVYQLTGAQFKAMGFASKPNANQVQLYGMDLAKLMVPHWMQVPPATIQTLLLWVCIRASVLSAYVCFCTLLRTCAHAFCVSV
jgi:hypothetical protein